LYLVVDPRSPLIPGFAMATIPFAAAFVPSGWIRKSAMMMPTTPRPRRPRNDVGRMSGLTELRLHERVVGPRASHARGDANPELHDLTSGQEMVTGEEKGTGTRVRRER